MTLPADAGIAARRVPRVDSRLEHAFFSRDLLNVWTDRPTGYLTLLLRHRNFAPLWLSGLLAYFAIWTSNIVVLDVVNDAMHSALAAAVI